MHISLTQRIRKFVWDIKSVWASNKVTLLLVLSYTVWEAAIAAVPYEYYWDIHFFVDMISRVLGCLIVPSLFLETCFAKSPAKCIGGYIVAVIFSVQVIALLPEKVQQIIGPRGSLFKECAEWFWGSVLVILSVAIVYKSFKSTKLPFIKYIINVFCNVAKSVAVWFVLFICSAYVDGAIQSRLLRSYYFEYDIQTEGRILVMDTFWMGPVEILVMGFYLGPKLILALKDMREKV